MYSHNTAAPPNTTNAVAGFQEKDFLFSESEGVAKEACCTVNAANTDRVTYLLNKFNFIFILPINNSFSYFTFSLRRISVRKVDAIYLLFYFFQYLFLHTK